MTEPLERWQRALVVLEGVLDLDGTERERAIDSACDGDGPLAALVRRWLAASDAAAPLGDWTALDPATVERPGAPLAPGTRVGAWEVIRVAGTGGMGTVYEAARADGAFERRAALKVVRHAGDVALLSERLRGERSILATLDHPNIARLLDGGVTEEGLPWYVMELVEGTPIDTWCDARALPVGRRLDLFRQVCDAVQYAHQRLVVHRDLKPSNILVTGAGEVKLLDFGIAGLLVPSTDGASRDSAPPAVNALLTPEYAGPEQRRGAAPTVAADIYSLGVVLHELLVGTRPSTIEQAEPPLISSLTVLPARASARGTTPEHLHRQLAGDVDAIVATALRHEPAARYGSAGLLGEDLASHLGNFPVRARPDRWSYRAGRFIRRHQLGVALGAVALVAVLATSIESVRQARLAERQARAAAQSADFVVGLLQLSYPFDSGGTTPSMRAMLDSGAARVATLERQGIAVPVSLYEVLALGYNGMARYDRAVALDSQALALRIAAGDPDTVLAGTRWQLAEDLRLGGQQRAAALEYRRIVPLIAQFRGDRSPRMAQLLQPLARAHRSMNELGTVDSLLDLVESILEANPGQGRIARAHAHVTRGHVALERGDLDRAEREYQAALDLRRAIGASDLEVANSNGDLAGVARRRGNLALADSLIAWSIAVKRKHLGDMHPEVGDDLREMGAIALARHDYAAAEQSYRDALLRYEGAGPVPQWRSAPLRVGLASVLASRGQSRQADSLLALVIDDLARLETTPSSLQLAARRLRASLQG